MQRELELAGEADAKTAVGGWLAYARARFESAYRSALARAHLSAAIDPALLRAFEVEKACYEVRYEANNRPDWLWLPISGLRSLVGG